MSPTLVSGAIALVVVAWLAACAEAGLARVSSFRAEEAVKSGRRGSAKLAQVAAKQGQDAPTQHSMDEELQLLTVHGVLHLLGYDHEEPDEKAEMFGLQAAIVDGWRAEKGMTGPSPAPTVS